MWWDVLGNLGRWGVTRGNEDGAATGDGSHLEGDARKRWNKAHERYLRRKQQIKSGPGALCIFAVCVCPCLPAACFRALGWIPLKPENRTLLSEVGPSSTLLRGIVCT